MLDFDALRQAIRSMPRHSKLYHLLKDELTALGHWRNKPRGNPALGYKMRGTKGDNNGVVR